jgi:hypothetical protein
VWKDQVIEVCSTYREAIELYTTHGIHTFSIDEQTGIQAIERIAADFLLRSSLVARREYEYIRHGTLAFFGKLQIATGQILKPMLRETRNEEDFFENIDSLACTAPNAQWRFVTDKLNTHASESLLYYVAEQCGLEIDLGLKGRRGVLQSIETRQDFLSDKSYRIRFVYTPKHCSWLKEIEIWFGTLRRKLTRFGSFCSLDDLEDQKI